jgi:hypothetical protein
MTAFLKLDPWALLAERKQATAKTTLAGLAGLAAPPPENENLVPSTPENEKSRGTPAKVAKPAKVQDAFPFAEALDALERRCPNYVPTDRWQQCIEDAQRFLADWGPQAEALGWTSAELLGLHTPPANPHPSYHRLSRYDCTGLIWGLNGRRVIALTEDTAAVETSSGAALIYRKHRKPAFGPMGDSLDDFIA